MPRQNHAMSIESNLLLGLLLDLGLVLFSLLGLVGLAPLGKNSQSLVDLFLESRGRLDQVEELSVVHLEQHAGNLSSEVGLRFVNQGVEGLSEHLLLLGRSSSGKRLSSQLGRSSLSGLGSGLLRSNGHLTSGHGSGGETLGSADGRSGRSGGRGSGVAVGSVVGGHTWVARHLRGHAVWHGDTGLSVGSRVSRSSLLHHGRVTHGSTSHGHHTRLTSVSGHGRVAVHGGLHVAGGAHGSSAKGDSLSLSLLHLRLQGLSSDILSLSKRDVEGLGTDHLAVHVLDGLGRLVGGGKADETKVSRGTILILHDLARGDGSKGIKLGSESVIIPLVVEVFNVEVDTGRLGLVFESLLLVGLSQLVVSLGSLLGSTNVELLPLPLLVVELLGGFDGRLMRGVVDKTKPFRSSRLVDGEGGRDNLSVSLKELFKLGLGSFRVDVFDENVGELSSLFFDLGLSLLFADVVADVDFLVVEQHAVDGLDGGIGGFSGGIVHKGESSRLAILIDTDLARENLSKRDESVVESLVVDRLVEVFDEDVSLTRLSEGRISLRPHDSARSSLDQRVVEVLHGSLSIGSVEKVDIGVPEGSSGDCVSTDSDGSDGTDHVEDFKQHGLGDCRVELTDVERRATRRGLDRASGRGGLRLSRSRTVGLSNGGGRGRCRGGGSVGHSDVGFFAGYGIDHVKGW